jgi:hypothetical protein
MQSLEDLSHVPSLLHNEQMDECERIKLALSKKHINIPAGVLERSIVIPEDLPFSLCCASLPTPSSGFFEDISLQPAKKNRAKSSRSSRSGSRASTSLQNYVRPNSSRFAVR